MGNPRIVLEPGGHYHIFNHAVGKDNLFREDENYRFFLRKLPPRIIPFADILAYCLMPNHFHFVVRIKSHEQLTELWHDKLKRKKAKSLLNKESITPVNELFDGFVITQFSGLFSSYVQAYNNKYSRQGTLLKESFQRKAIESSDYLLKLICYVHNNPVDHGFMPMPESWPYSSYNAIISDAKTNVLREEVLEMFGGRENFKYMHRINLGGEI